MDRPALERCPLCRNPVKKLVSRVNSPRVAKPFSAVDAKKAGLVNQVKPLLDRLQALHFRVSPKTRKLVLELAREAP